MNTYCVKRIIVDNNNNDEYYYWNKVKNATIIFCNGIKETREYCGGKLHRVTNISDIVYGGINPSVNGDIYYRAYKID